MRRKKVLIRAYLNHNLGDDLFVYILCKRYPEIHFSIIGEENVRNITNEIENLHFISEEAVWAKIINKIYKLIQKIKGEEICNYRNYVLLNILSKHFEENVFVTGSFFIQNSEWSIMHDAMWYDSKPFILGCNFGPYWDERYFVEHKTQFQKCKQIVFREMYSQKLFEDLNNVSVAPDLVFNLDTSNYMMDAYDYYIISVVDLTKDDNQNNHEKQRKYEQSIVDAISQLMSDGSKVILLSFCEEQGDGNVIGRIMNEVGDERVKSFSYEAEGIEKTLELISHSKGIIATRYHAMILGFVFRKPIVPVLYSKKMSNVLSDIGYQGYCLDLTDKDKNDFKVDNWKETMYLLPDDVRDNLIDMASKGFERLDDVLNISTKI